MATKTRSVAKKVKKRNEKKVKEYVERDDTEVEDVGLQLMDVGGSLTDINSQELTGSPNISHSTLLYSSKANRGEEDLCLQVVSLECESDGTTCNDHDFVMEENSGLTELAPDNVQQYCSRTRDVGLKRTVDEQRIEICQLEKKLSEQWGSLQTERVDAVRSVCTDLVSAMSSCSSDQFTERIQLLRQLLEIWSQGEDVDVKCNEPTTVTATLSVEDLRRVIGDHQSNVYIKVDCKDGHMATSVVDKAGQSNVTDSSTSPSAVVADRQTDGRTAVVSGSQPVGSTKTAAYQAPVMPRRKPGDPVVPFPCSVCGKTFRFYSQLEQHKRYHAGVRPWPCSQCGRRFALQCSRDKHATIHSSDRPLMCDVCGQRFAHINYLKSHQRTHQQERPYTCQQCSRQFAHAASLRHHTVVRHRDQPDEQFTCHQCGQVFSSVTDVRAHLRLHTGDEEGFDCEMCSELFDTYSDLEKHLEAVHDVSPSKSTTAQLPRHSRRYQCRLCGRCFSQPGNLRRHTLTHTGVRPWECHLCGRRFTQPGNLKSHLRIHTGERPFVCLACGSQFTEATTLRKHTLRHCSVSLALDAAVVNTTDDDDDDDDDVSLATETDDELRLSSPAVIPQVLSHDVMDCAADAMKLQFT